MPRSLADPNQIELALLNLSVKARDSATAETVRPEQNSRLTPGDDIRLPVGDTGGWDGRGNARAPDPAVFLTKGVGKGTGLGLSMVHGLASQLGGALGIQSQPGVGTNVDLWLPQTQAPPAKVLRMRQEEQASGPTRGVALLVDDEELVRRTTPDMLSDLGHRVVEAASGEQAICRLEG